MNQKFLKFALPVLLCFISATSAAQSVDQAVKELRRQLQQLRYAPDIVGLSVSVVQGQKVLLRETLGVRDRKDSQPIDEETRFRVASLSKGFASTLAGMLVEEDQMSWDEPVHTSLDWFRLPTDQHTRQATLNHVVSHRLGLPHYTHDRLLEANWQVKAIISNFPKLKPQCEVGSCYGYQNIGYNVVADLIEAKTGNDFETLVDEKIFKPLDMKRANFGHEGLSLDENWARPHKGRQIKQVDVLPTYYRVPASAGINASLLDMEQWLAANLLRFPDVIDALQLHELREPQVVTRREIVRGGWRTARVNNAWYGRGWRIYDYQGETMIYHAGAVSGYRAQLALLPERDLGIVVLWNSESARPYGIVPTLTDSLLNIRANDWMKLKSIKALVKAP